MSNFNFSNMVLVEESNFDFSNAVVVKESGLEISPVWNSACMEISLAWKSAQRGVQPDLFLFCVGMPFTAT